MDKKEYKVSVRDMVSFVLRSGDLIVESSGPNRTLEGLFAHIKHQKDMGEDYKAEIHVKKVIDFPSFKLKISGRIDGLYEEDDLFIIDEIKTTYAPLDMVDEDFNPLHWAQVLCYGFIYCEENELDNIILQLTYIQLEFEQIKRLKKKYTFKQLKEEFMELVDTYGRWVEKLERYNNQMLLSTNALEFPFEDYRTGQRDLAVATYKTIQEGKGAKLFARAPTGTGKTLATLFPAIKALGTVHGDKVFYLTAKTIGREVANKTLDLLEDNGLNLKRITLTAKDKMCFLEERNCSECEYTVGYYDKLNQVMEDILEHEDSLTRDVLSAYGRKYNVCPFELSLDVSLFCHVIVCDYNYVFDPRVSLKRYFQENSKELILLVDEAHNLVDRGREMFSASLTKKPILELKRAFKEENVTTLKRYLKEVNDAFVEFRKICDENKGQFKQTNKSDNFIKLLRKLQKQMDIYLTENKVFSSKELFLQVFFDVTHFIKISDLYDQRYVTYYEKVGQDVLVRMYCLDPSYQLGLVQESVRTTIIFSATLLPMDYYVDLLGGDELSYRMTMASPFTKEHLGLFFHSGISTKYKDREDSYIDVAMSIRDTIVDGGNYFVFFPSYSYLHQVCDYFKDLYEDVDILIQKQGMSEAEKEDFLEAFKSDNKGTMVAFAVMGSSFSEGIDLIGDRLKGVVIVGVGLPMVCFQQNIIKEYFDEKNHSGFNYAYIYPGMNKVLQSVGRVIRSEEDLGVATLIDERFSYNSYQSLFPREWSHGRYVYNHKQLESGIKAYWDQVRGEENV